MQISLTRRGLVSGGVLTLVLITTNLAVLWTTHHLLSTTGRMTRSDHMLQALDAFPLHLAQATEAYRDFMLTGDEQPWNAYQQATAGIHQRLAELQLLVVARPEQAQRLASLAALVQEQLRQVQHFMQLRQDQGGEAALMAIARDGGSDAVEHMQAFVQDLEGAERRSLTTRATRAHAVVQRLQRLALGGTMLLLLGVTGVTILIRPWSKE